MILTTTPQIEGHTIHEYKGVVTREAMDDAIAFIDEKHPTENELVEYIAKLCS